MSSQRNNFYIQRKIAKRTDFRATFTIILLLIVACSPQRNTSATRAYHEFTTRYNIYYNAEEAYHEILNEQSNNYLEDYTKLIPFYPTSVDKHKTTKGGPFDPVIEKTEKAIRAHSISTKPRRDPTKAYSQEYRQWLRQEEFNPFLKNVWLLRGKAFLQNGDFDEALSVFSGMMRLYNDDSELVNAIEIWMLRTYTDMEKWYDAEKTAYSLQNKKLTGNLERLYTEHFTYFLIQNKKFEAVIPFLLKTITQEPDYIRKKRWQFLLGQLYVMSGESENAYQAFKQVKGLRTPSKLAINATRWQSILTNDTLTQALKLMHPENRLSVSEQKIAIGTNKEISIATLNEKNIQHRENEDETVNNQEKVVNSKGRFFFAEERTLAENATLHRQWRLQNGLWLSRTDDFGETEQAQTVPFTPDRSGKHSLLLIFRPDSTDKKQLLFATSNYNFSFFKLRKFNINSIWMSTMEALQIEPFYSFEETFRYTDQLHSDSLFRTVSTGTTPIIISEENLKRLMSGNSIDEYTAYYAENIAADQIGILPAKSEKHDVPVINEQNKRSESEKIVSLNKEDKQPLITFQDKQDLLVEPNSLIASGQETAEMVKQRLEENASKAQQRQQIATPQKSRKQLLKEREKLRKEKIRQREQAQKERERKRKEELKQREKERVKKR